jgi:hypothetical protein
MQLILRLRSFRVSAGIICLLLVVAYLGIIARDMVAERLGTSGDSQAIRRAIALDPGNARYRNNLGEVLRFSEQHPDLAIPQYQYAASLNPYLAEYWLDLASAYSSTGAQKQQQWALERALEVDPNTPMVSREVADAFFIRGDRHRALTMYRELLRTDLWQTESILEICWQGTHDVDAVSEALPPVARVHLEFLNLLIGEQEKDAAEQMWSRLIALRQPFDLALARPYVEYLIAEKDIRSARTAWEDLGRTNPSFRVYLPAAGNLVVNSGFEQKITNMGFDWRYAPNSHALLAVDAEQFHSGSRSLSVTFDGEPVVDTGLSQLIPVEADRRYSFSAYAKTQDISTARGPQLAVVDARTSKPLFVTEEILDTTDWKQLSGSFETGPDTNVVSLKIIRNPGAERITGQLWIDDVVVTKD